MGEEMLLNPLCCVESTRRLVVGLESHSLGW